MAIKVKIRLLVAHFINAVAKCLIFNDIAKGRLLACKTWPLGMRKATFWKTGDGFSPFHLLAFSPFQAFSPCSASILAK